MPMMDGQSTMLEVNPRHQGLGERQEPAIRIAHLRQQVAPELATQIAHLSRQLAPELRPHLMNGLLENSTNEILALATPRKTNCENITQLVMPATGQTRLVIEASKIGLLLLRILEIRIAKPIVEIPLLPPHVHIAVILALDHTGTT